MLGIQRKYLGSRSRQMGVYRSHRFVICREQGTLQFERVFVNLLPWAICSMAEGSAIHQVEVCGMNNESFQETFPASVPTFSFHLTTVWSPLW